MIPTSQTATTRLLYTVIGGGAGLCTYVLAMIVPEAVAHARAVLFLLSFGLGFLAILLALMGPVRVTLAAAAALGIALPAALLLLWASYRHETPSAFLDGGYGLAAFLYLLFISTLSRSQGCSIMVDGGITACSSMRLGIWWCASPRQGCSWAWSGRSSCCRISFWALSGSAPCRISLTSSLCRF